MSFDPSESTILDVTRPTAGEIAPGLLAELNSGTLLNWRMNLRLGAEPRVSQRIPSATSCGDQSVHASAMMLFGLAVDAIEPALGNDPEGRLPNSRKPLV